jgi:hypothetical protein
MRDRSSASRLPFDAAVFTSGFISDWLLRSPNCECCGRKLDIGFKTDGKGHDDSPSIDRIIGSLGYVVGNVALLCWRCNCIKRDATWKELSTVANWLKRKIKGHGDESA